jgi:hypothetical protein
LKIIFDKVKASFILNQMTVDAEVLNITDRKDTMNESTSAESI